MFIVSFELIGACFTGFPALAFSIELMHTRQLVIMIIIAISNENQNIPKVVKQKRHTRTKLLVIMICTCVRNKYLIFYKTMTYCRSVYEDDSQSDFLKKLDEHSKDHEKEIERMCNFHYQGFVESVSELIRVRTDANQLKVCIICFLLD